MGQSFILVNLDKREKVQYSKLSESFYEFDIHRFLCGRKFTVLTTAEYIAAQQRRDAVNAAFAAECGESHITAVYRRDPQTDSALLRILSIDAISLCLGFTDTLRDKACFALACQATWDIARRDIVKDLRAYETWAGDRIICVGDWTSLNDFPPNVLTEEELATMRDLNAGKWKRGPEGKLERAESSDVSTSETSAASAIEELYWIDFIRARGMVDFPFPIYEIQEWLHDKLYERGNRRLPARRPFGQEDWQIWKTLVCGRRNTVAAEGTVLRNLTTKEYIRGDAFLEARRDPPYTYSPICRWDFGDSLLLRISWSFDDGAWDAIVGSASRCAWAGHRFDFVHEDSLPRDAEGKVLPPWKDMSKDVIDDVLCCSSD